VGYLFKYLEKYIPPYPDEESAVIREMPESNEPPHKTRKLKKQVDVFPYLKTRRLCVLLHYIIKLPLVY